MYSGHAALALLFRARRPDVPVLPLLLASYGPDIVDLALMIPKPKEGMAPYSHSLPAVFGFACVAALLYQAILRRPGALVVGSAWVVHWFADLITGIKPFINLNHMVGLDVYHLPWLDFVIEVLVVSVACIEFARAFAPTGRKRMIMLAAWAALVMAQAAMDVTVAHLDPSEWRPTLAQENWRPHVRLVASLAVAITPHGSCTARLHSQRGETWRRKDQLVWSRLYA